MMYSRTANTSTHRHTPNACLSEPLRIAIGIRMRVASPVRAMTSEAGSSSSTTILMKKYGMPQVTAMIANRT